MQTLKRLRNYWWKNFQHAFHGAVKFLHGLLFIVAVVGTISPHFFLTEERMTQYTHKFSIFILIAYLLWIAFHRHEEKEKELQQQKTNSENQIEKLRRELQALKEDKPSLQILWHTDKPCLERDGDTFYCRLQIRNTSSTAPAQDVEVKLISIVPPPPSGWGGSLPILLPRKITHQHTIHPLDNLYVNLLSVERSPGQMKLTFGDQESFNAEGILQSRRFQDYVLEIFASSLTSALTERFKLELLGDVSLSRIS